MIKPLQIKLIHIYKHAAGLSQPAYRQILRTHAGVFSSADPDMSQSGFELVMAALETILWQRVDTADAPPPKSRFITSRWRWRERLPAPGKINSRQYRKIMQQWNQLAEFLPPGQATPAYFAGIVSHATGRPDLGASALTSAQAGMVIDALTDRLNHAIRQPALQNE